MEKVPGGNWTEDELIAELKEEALAITRVLLAEKADAKRRGTLEKRFITRANSLAPIAPITLQPSSVRLN